MDNKTVYFVSLGCPKNLVDSEIMLGRLVEAGWQVTRDEHEADCIFVFFINVNSSIASIRRIADFFVHLIPHNGDIRPSGSRWLFSFLYSLPILPAHRSSILRLRAPLLTLRHAITGRRRIARGRSGSLHLTPWKTCTSYSMPVFTGAFWTSQLLPVETGCTQKFLNPTFKIFEVPLQFTLITNNALFLIAIIY
jgi:hypothetical protein